MTLSLVLVFEEQFNLLSVHYLVVNMEHFCRLSVEYVIQFQALHAVVNRIK